MTSPQRLRRVCTVLLSTGLLSTGLLTTGLGAAPAAAVTAPATESPFIVTMLPSLGLGADALDAAAESLAGGGVTRTLPIISGFAASLTPREVARLKADPRVASVSPDRIVRRAATQVNPRWNLDRIDQRSRTLNRRYTPLSGAATVHAYIIDTGLRTTHQEFEGRASSGYDFVRKRADVIDCDGHGTHVAGVIGGRGIGVAKSVRLVGVRVLDCNGSGRTSDVIAGINWVTRYAKKPAVANMSLGGYPDANLDAAVRKSIASGVTYVLAAGNENVNACRTSPARVTGGITVGATNASDTRAPFSNWGTCVDLFAPGVSIASAYKSSNSSYATMSGTSMASPHVAGAVAMLLAQTATLTPGQVASRLITATTKNTVRNRGKDSPSRVLFTPAPPPVASVATASLPDATVGQTYLTPLTRTPALVGFWSATGLPAGLTVSRAGRIGGVPAEPGVFEVQLRFTDFVPRDSNRTLTLTVNP